MNKFIFRIFGAFLALVILVAMFRMHTSIASLMEKSDDLSTKIEYLSQDIQSIKDELQSTENRLSSIETSLEKCNSRIIRLENLHMSQY